MHGASAQHDCLSPLTLPAYLSMIWGERAVKLPVGGV
jgi:hypothetical protein